MTWLRRFRAAYWIRSWWHKKTLDCNAELYKKFGLQQSVTGRISHATFATEAVEHRPWLDDEHISELDVERVLALHQLPPAQVNAVRGWSANGYAILEQFFSQEQCNVINSEVDNLLAERSAQQRLDERIIFAIHKSKKVYDLCTQPTLTKLLGILLGREVKLFQSLNFIHGSSQLAHSDTIHMTTHPLGYMIAVWIALEDIDADSGPLFYYPGSHRLPYVLNKDYEHGGNYFLLGKNAYQKYEEAIQHIIAQNNFEQKIFLAKKGDAFIWHANILHGGMPIVNPLLTRKSMVLHFYAKDVICYHEITERPAIFGGNEAHCAAAM